MLREHPALAPFPAGDVDPPPLHEMAGQADAPRISRETGASGKRWIEQAKQPVEGRLVAAVRRRGQQE